MRSVELVPGHWRIEGGMGLDETRPGKKRAIPISISQKLDRAVGCPVGRMMFGGQLGRLRYVIKLAPYSMWLINVFVIGFR